MRILHFTLIALGWPAAAQELLSLREAAEQALSRHPILQAGERRIAVSEGLSRQAGRAPNPTFVFQQENLRSLPEGSTFWTFTDTFAYAQQTFETSGKRRRRVESAEVGVERAQLERELLRKQIAGRVKQAYWAAAGAQHIHASLNETVASFRRTVEYHEMRVKEGAMAEADLLRVRLESERLQLAVNNAFLEAERFRIALFREMGADAIPSGVHLEEPAPPGNDELPTDLQLALDQRTELKLARLGVRQAEADLRLARANGRPDVTALAGLKRTSGYNTLLVGMQVDMPFWNRNEGNIDATTARIEAVRAELVSATAVVRAEVEAARRGYEIRRLQILESLEPMRRQAMESARIAQAAYLEGGWELLRLLDAERLLIETETLYHQALTEYRQSLVELELAMGVEP